MKNQYLFSLVLALSLGFTQDRTITIKKGQILDLVAAHFKSAEAQQKAGAYFGKVFPMASKHGFKPVIVFNTINFKEEHFSASGFGLYTWPAKKNLYNLNKESEWPKIKSTRPNYWQNLRVNHFEVKKDLSLTFKKEKIYRVNYIWLYDYYNSDENLDRYMKGMEKVRKKLGARTVFAFKNGGIEFESLNNDRAPDRVAMIEWPSEEAHKKYLESKEFQDYKKYFFSAVSEFEAFNVLPKL